MKLNIILVISLCISSLCQNTGKNQLKQQMEATLTIINLYQQKLQKLKEMYYGNTSSVPEKPILIQPSIAQVSEQKIVLIKEYPGEFKYLPPYFLVSSNKIVNFMNGEEHEYIGKPIIFQQFRLTTLVGSTVSITTIKQDHNRTQIESDLLGFTANHTENSFWVNHSEDDILVQFFSNFLTIKRRNKQIEKIQFEDQIVSAYKTRQKIKNTKIMIILTTKIIKYDIDAQQTLTSIDINDHVGKTERNVQILSISGDHPWTYMVLSNNQIAKCFNDHIHSVFNITGVSQPLNSLHIQHINPYFFLNKHKQNNFEIINQTSSNKWLSIQLPDKSNQSKLYFDKIKDSYIVIESNENKTRCYEILIPTNISSKQLKENTFGFKIVGVILVIVIVIYLKNKNSNEEGYQQISRGKKPNHEAQIQQYLRYAQKQQKSKKC